MDSVMKGLMGAMPHPHPHLQNVWARTTPGVGQSLTGEYTTAFGLWGRKDDVKKLKLKHDTSRAGLRHRPTRPWPRAPRF